MKLIIKQGKYVTIISLLFFLLLKIIETDAQTPAFPGAEGFGATTITGGRGGVVYEVTNLNDDGSGSLRAAINASGTRTVVFKVSGIIELESNLDIKNDNITIAGQTAPGDGICLKNYPLKVGANNVIIRFIRSRLGDEKDIEDDAMNGRNRSNIIIDHCSMSWSVDECGSFYDNTNFIMQWCILSESLYHSLHEKGNHGYGGIWGGMGASFHHNLLAHHTSRNPRFCGSRYHGQPDKEIVDHRNNVIFNWGGNSAYGGEAGNHNMVANYYKPGPATSDGVKERIIKPDANENGYGTYYVEGNVFYNNTKVSNDNWTYGVQISDDIKAIIKLDEAIPAPDITQHMAEEAFEHVLVYAGAVIPSRDEIDTRIIYETFTGTAQYGTYYSGGGNGIIDTPSDVGGWPAYNSTTPPADSDHDGMPDDWETANDLNPNDASDRNGDSDADGYTNLEEYLNSLVDNFKYLVRPIHFKIDSTDNNLIYLSWTDISDNETGFIIERSSGEGFNEVASLPANTTTYIDNTITESGFYKYRIKAFNDEIESFYTDSIAVSLNITLFTGNFSSENIDLKINPNPFYDIANISYNITNRTTTHLSIYDLTGKEIACIVNKIQIPGAYHYVLNGNQLENGIYIIKLKTNNSVSFIKILKLK